MPIEIVDTLATLIFYLNRAGGRFQWTIKPYTNLLWTATDYLSNPWLRMIKERMTQDPIWLYAENGYYTYQRNSNNGFLHFGTFY
jgi:hypothetical protein